MGWLDAWLGKAPAQKDRSTVVLSWLAGSMTLVALVLFALQQSLRLPAHFGVEDWLGWANLETLGETLKAWGLGTARSRVPAATAYLLIDTALFMPLYGLTLLWATRQVLGSLKLGQGPAAWVIALLARLAVPLLLALWALIGAACSLALTPGARLLRRSACSVDRPALFAADFALSHACWLVCYPLAGWVATVAGMTTAFVVLGVLTAAGAVVALRLWPTHDPEVVEHEHHDLEPHHEHLHGAVLAGGVWRHSHEFRIDDHHLRWP